MVHPEYPDVGQKAPPHPCQKVAGRTIERRKRRKGERRGKKGGRNLKETETIQTTNNLEVRRHRNQ